MSETADEAEERVDKVMEWRQRELERAGYEPTDALRLASDRSVDLYMAVELIHRGCPHKTAIRIL